MQVFAENEDLVQLRHLLKSVSVKLAGFCEVPGFQRLFLETINLQEFFELSVTSISEHSLLQITNIVHLQRPHEGHLDAEAPVSSCTVETNEYAVVN